MSDLSGGTSIRSRLGIDCMAAFHGPEDALGAATTAHLAASSNLTSPSSRVGGKRNQKLHVAVSYGIRSFESLSYLSSGLDTGI